MGIARACDRCGAFYSPYNTTKSSKDINGFMTLNITSPDQRYYSHGPYDLCSKCSDELMAWFKKE